MLITGGTGKVGGRAAAQLGAKGVAVRVGSRSGDPRFDWTDHSSWDAALDGVKKVFIVPHDGEKLTRPFVQRAKELGVERVVLLSGRGADVPGYAGEDSIAGRTHIDGEDAVRTSGLEWTIVRPTWFAQNFSEGLFRDLVLGGELRLPAGDGAVSFVDAEDIAGVAVASLAQDKHVGQTYELSGPSALTIGQVADLISSATGRRVRYTPLAPQDFVAELVAEGWSLADAEDYADAVGPIRRNMDSRLSHGVQTALGRSPRSFALFVKEAAAAGAWRH
ncbi:NAD(P)H-binding protein [Streptomyces sp. NPDC014870]|uniref:NAD(P)H-binding protein n=1 Tax=Streptomyces sp. NPDC014870 TaxID=3364925 RepID=UPI0036FB89EE